MRVAITGSTGLIGSELTRQLRAQGHDVTRVSRSYSGLPRTERIVIWHPERGAIESEGLEGHDVVIHLAGESIAGVWTDGKKRRIRESRVRGTSLLAETLATLKSPPRTFFSGSAFGIYGDHPRGEVVDERTPPGTGFLAEVAQEWEAATGPAQRAGIRTVHMRFSNVLSGNGGMLGPFVPLFKLGLGAKFGDGSQYWGWIAIDDVTPALLHVLERPEISGPVNFTSPNPVTNEEFTRTLAAVVGRPSFLKMPAIAARVAPGHMVDEMLLAGARVVPRVLLEAGYEFRLPELKGALRTLLR